MPGRGSAVCPVPQGADELEDLRRVTVGEANDDRSKSAAPFLGCSDQHPTIERGKEPPLFFSADQFNSRWDIPRPSARGRGRGRRPEGAHLILGTLPRTVSLEQAVLAF